MVLLVWARLLFQPFAIYMEAFHQPTNRIYCMAVLYFEGQRLAIDKGESVLDAVLRSDLPMTYGCKAGACQTCLLLVDAGEVPPQSQEGLTDTQKKLGCFLSCRCHPGENAELRVRSARQFLHCVSATLVDKMPFNRHIYRLRFQAPISWFPGQYVTLWRNENLSRSYSIASVPTTEDFLEFHIKRLEDGAFSRWACDELQPGDSLQVQGPMGKCFYAAQIEQPLLLACMGTGLAPVYGVLRDALHQGHQGPIHLYAGARLAENIYLIDELLHLAEAHPNLSITFIAQSGLRQCVRTGDFYQLLGENFPNLKGFKVYICGAGNFVRKLKKQTFLAGANMQDIAADAFLPFDR